jgi:4'-phosphopantetheinyl transferase
MALDVWVLELGDAPDLGAASALLDGSERDRAVRFRFDADRLRFIARRALVRTVLGAAVGVDPAAVRVDTTCRRCGDPRHGKPRLVGGGPDFSASSSDRVVVVAVADRCEVGVDVEALARCQRSELAATVCSEAEQALLAAGGLEFCRLWVRKEAVVKLSGAGLVQPLEEVDVASAGAWAEEPVRVAEAWIRDVEAPAGYAIALATDVPGPSARRVSIGPDWLAR